MVSMRRRSARRWYPLHAVKHPLLRRATLHQGSRVPQRPPFRRRCRIVTSGHAKQARLSTIGHAVRCTQAPDHAHPAPPPGGVAPSWINVVPSARPAGQLSVPSVEDLAAITLRRAYERVEAGEAGVTIRDAVAVLRLAHEIEHDDALAERDAARRQMEEWKYGYGSSAMRSSGSKGPTPGRRSRPRSVSSALLYPGNWQPGWLPSLIVCHSSGQPSRRPSMLTPWRALVSCQHGGCYVSCRGC